MIAFIPNREYVDSLKAGDFAMNCFGKMAEVVAINFRGTSHDGRRFVGYSTRSGTGSSITMSQKEGRLTRHSNLPYNSAELDKLEKTMLGGGVVRMDLAYQPR